MKNFSQYIQDTQKYFISVMSAEMNSVDDREEQDMELEKLEADIQNISDEIGSQPSYMSVAQSLVNTLKEYQQEHMAKDLEIGMAYASQ
jgi:hypothetical protein